MEMKNLKTYICASLILLNIISCYNSRLARQDREVAFEDQYAEVEVTRTADISFESLNPLWKKAHKDRVGVDKADSLDPDYPNPFSPPPTCKLHLTEPDSIHLSLWDSSGRMICSLYESFLGEGLYEMQFIKSNLNSGVYSVLLRKGNLEYTKKIVLFR